MAEPLRERTVSLTTHLPPGAGSISDDSISDISISDDSIGDISISDVSIGDDSIRV
jgi:hypothetical protein